MIWSNQATLLVSSALLVADVLPVAAGKIIIPKSSFDCQKAFDLDWNYNYRWGTDHNGGARMTVNNTKIDGGVLTLTANRVKNQPPAKHGGKDIKINYLSGAIHSKDHFTFAPGGGYDFSAELRAPTGLGTWPAFWVTGLTDWPPEIDIAEWKGKRKISFNTFNTSSVVAAKDVDYPDPDEFHKVKCETRDINGKDVEVKFYLDGELMTTQVGGGYVGQTMYLIINLQMEGSSGPSGPPGTTIFQVRNVEVVSHNPKDNDEKD